MTDLSTGKRAQSSSLRSSLLMSNHSLTAVPRTERCIWRVQKLHRCMQEGDGGRGGRERLFILS